MRRTELREQFFAEVQRDPYAHMIARLWTQAWAEGYEQALREHGLESERLRESFSDRIGRAQAYLTEAQRKSETQAIIAMAQLGRSWRPANSVADPSEPNEGTDGSQDFH